MQGYSFFRLARSRLRPSRHDFATARQGKHVGTIELLQACVKQGASDIHIVVGQPPVCRVHGRMRKLDTKVLEPDDTVALMKSMAPECSQLELQEKGSAEFGYASADLIPFRVTVFQHRGNVSMVLRQTSNNAQES